MTDTSRDTEELVEAVAERLGVDTEVVLDALEELDLDEGPVDPEAVAQLQRESSGPEPGSYYGYD